MNIKLSMMYIIVVNNYIIVGYGMAKIYDIKWIDEEEGEAEVYIITNRGLKILCFGCPFNGEIGDNLSNENEIYALDAENVMRVNSREYEVHKLNKVWDYRIIGEIVNIEDSLIKVDDLLIELGEYALYGDAKIGDFVSATISILDIW